MYELIKLTDKNYYIDGYAKVGVVLLENDEVVLIDSGNDRDTGEQIMRILGENGWRLRAIFNTHFHADHIRGNAYLQEHTGCKIYVPDFDRGFARNTLLDPAIIYGGNPPEELCKKFLMAPSSDAEMLRESVLPKGMQIVPLSGHTYGMVGYKTDDGVIYLADSLLSAETLEKHKICFVMDVGAYLETLENIKMMKARFFVPSHASVTDDILPLVKINAERVYAIGEDILALCKSPMTFDELLAEIFDFYGITMNIQQHSIIGSTVRSYLVWLKQRGMLTFEFSGNRMLWKRI